MKTCDLVDQYEDLVRVAESIGLVHFGGISTFSGSIQTLKCFEDNSLIKQTLSQPGEGRILVVDGAGSKRSALIGDVIASLGVKNGWRGIVLNGCIRDSLAIKELPLGVMALGTTPKKSTKHNLGIIGAPISFAGIEFVPGHYIYADADGIVVASEELNNVTSEND